MAPVAAPCRSRRAPPCCLDPIYTMGVGTVATADTPMSPRTFVDGVPLDRAGHGYVAVSRLILANPDYPFVGVRERSRNSPAYATFGHRLLANLTGILRRSRHRAISTPTGVSGDPGAAQLPWRRSGSCRRAYPASGPRLRGGRPRATYGAVEVTTESRADVAQPAPNRRPRVLCCIPHCIVEAGCAWWSQLGANRPLNRRT